MNEGGEICRVTRFGGSIFSRQRPARQGREPGLLGASLAQFRTSAQPVGLVLARPYGGNRSWEPRSGLDGLAIEQEIAQEVLMESTTGR